MGTNDPSTNDLGTTELTHALRTATADLEPRPGFTTAVLRGARRRRTRGRIVLATAAALVAAMAGATTVVLWSEPVTQVADPRLSEPTRGDLGTDQRFLSDAAAAWRRDLPPYYGADLRGAPHAYWAGNTPAGRAAVLLQPFYQSEGDLAPGDTDRNGLIVGLVAIDPTDGFLRLVFESPELFPGPTTSRFGVQFGPDDRTVLVLDPGTPLWFSAAPVAGPGGRLSRDWQPMPATDGVAITQVPGLGPASDARVLARPTRPAPDDRGSDVLRLEWAAEYVADAKAGHPATRPGRPSGRPALAWRDEGALRMMVGGPARPIPDVPGEPMHTFVGGLEQAGMLDFGFFYQGWGSWSVIGGLGDGRTVIVAEIVEDAHPSRIYAVLLNPDGSMSDAVRGDQADASNPLPVRLRLPDRQGWIVADYGATLGYRAAPDAPLRDAGPNAALLPDGTTLVEVSRGDSVIVVELPA